MSFFGSEFFGGGFYGQSTVGGRRKRKRTRFAAKIDGKLKVFDTLQEAEEYLASLREQKIDKVVAKAEAKSIKFGAVKTGYAVPNIKITKAEPEMVDLVSRENDRLRSEYIQVMLAFEAHIKAQLEALQDEEEAALLLS